MPFFFLYLYTNTIIMADELNKGLGEGKKLLKDMVQESGYLYDALMSIGTNIAASIDNFTEGMEGAKDTSEALANVYKKDIVNSIKKAARNTEKLVDLQNRINKGENVSKKINDELMKISSQRQVLAQKIIMARRNGIPINTKEIAGLSKQLKMKAAHLKMLLDQNEENMQSVSLTKVLSGSLSEMVGKLDKTGTLSKIMKGNFEETLTFARLGEIATGALIAGIIKGIVQLDKMQTEINRSFGMTDKTAMQLRSRFQGIAQNSENVLISVLDIQKAFHAISESAGIFAGTLRSDVLDGAAKLISLMGLSGDQATRLALNAQRTGQHMDDQTAAIAQGVINAENMMGVNLNAKKVFQESANITGMIRANLGRNYEIISETVGAAQALGLTLQDLASISQNMLNFQSSIEAELTAELFIGKQLNLEKARLYALTGDYNKLQKELMANVGSEYEFLSMNVLQKQKYAAALGMSVDQMSDLVMRNADLAEIERQAREGGRQDIVDEMQKLDLAQRMNKVMEKASTIFLNIAEGPLGTFASFLGNALASAEGVGAALGLISAISLMSLVSQAMALGTALKSAGIAAGIAKILMNPVKGMLAIGAAALGGMLIANLMKNANDVEPPKVKRFNTLGASEMVTLDRGSAIFDAGETVVRTDNFDKLTAGINNLIAATVENKPHKPLTKWETTTLYR